MKVYTFLVSIGFFYRFQSGFRSGDSTVMQLVYIVNKIYDCLDRGNEVRAVFLDISKAFDKVWHAGLLAKMKNLGVGGTLLNWFESYLKSRQQRVVIEGSSSSWKEVKAGVPQGSVLGPLLFLIYINDIQQNIDSDCFLFADDTMLLEEVFSPQSAARSLNKDLNSISLWSNRWLVTMNALKTKSMTFSLKKNKPDHPILKLSEQPIDEVSCHEHLGVLLSSNMS